MNEIMINDLYRYKNYQYLKKVLNYTLDKLNIKNVIFSIILVDEEYIQNLNKNFRGIDKVTDVISFAFRDENDIDNQSLLGDIYICIPKMINQAKEYNHSEKRELSFLAVHGLLHLLGYNHEIKSEEKIMFELQDNILKELNIVS